MRTRRRLTKAAAAAVVLAVAGWETATVQGLPQGLAPRVPVEFSIVRTTSVGQSVFVLGDIPELGGGDIRRAIKLAPTLTYPRWRATVELPAGAVYTYRYVVRADGPGQTSQTTNGSFITEPVAADVAAVPMATRSKVVWWNTPQIGGVLHVRPSGTSAATPFAGVPLEDFGPAPGGRPGHRVAFAWGFLPAGGSVDFFLTAPDGVSGRVPSTGHFTTRLDGAWVQDGQLYSYIPGPSVGPPRRDYSAANPPRLVAPQLGGESRGVRVFLPRGYAEHPGRRYPLLVMHDGQNVFESGAFGSWNAAAALTSVPAAGAMREVVVVAVDNGPSRLTDYLPPGDFLTGAGRADRSVAFLEETVKPWVAARYRIDPDPALTGIMGSSMGAVVSLYAGWDFSGSYRRLGLMSGAWQTCPTFLARVRTGPARPLRLWLDSGDSGTSADGYWNTLNLRDDLLARFAPPYGLSGAMQHTIGFGQQHNEAAWASRLPAALAWLYPAEEEPNDLLRRVFSPHWDRTADGRMDVEDLAAQEAGAGPATGPADLNGDGLVSPADAGVLEGFLRRSEAEGMARGR